eukprot:IDg20095t1
MVLESRLELIVATVALAGFRPNAAHAATYSCCRTALLLVRFAREGAVRCMFQSKLPHAKTIRRRADSYERSSVDFQNEINIVRRSLKPECYLALCFTSEAFLWRP